jgi:mRNA interferase RelE/StbE
VFEITWQTKATRQLLKFPPKDQKSIKNTVGTKLVDPHNASNVNKLKQHKYDYRLRVGNYRVYYNTIGGQSSSQMIVKVVSIEEVARRKTTTYKKR